MDMFGYSPCEEILILVKCIQCNKVIKANYFLKHLGILL